MKKKKIKKRQKIGREKEIHFEDRKKIKKRERRERKKRE